MAIRSGGAELLASSSRASLHVGLTSRHAGGANGWRGARLLAANGRVTRWTVRRLLLPDRIAQSRLRSRMTSAAASESICPPCGTKRK